MLLTANTPQHWQKSVSVVQGSQETPSGQSLTFPAFVPRPLNIPVAVNPLLFGQSYVLRWLWIPPPASVPHWFGQGLNREGERGMWIVQGYPLAFNNRGVEIRLIYLIFKLFYCTLCIDMIIVIINKFQQKKTNNNKFIKQYNNNKVYRAVKRL